MSKDSSHGTEVNTLLAQNSTLEAELLKARDLLREYQKFEQAVKSPALRYGIINHLPNPLNSDGQNHEHREYGVVFSDGDTLYLRSLPDLERKVQLGSSVLVHMESGTIVREAGNTINYPLTTVRELLGENQVVIKIGEREKVVVSAVEGVKRGDRVALDSAYSIVLKNYGRQTNQYFTEIPNMPWDRIAGLDTVIAQIQRDIVKPFTHPELYAAFTEKKKPKGVLLHGPPGVGKTMLGQAIATNIGAGSFLYLAGSELFQSLVGQGEEKIIALFAEGRERMAQTGKPVVIFLDEAEALRKRGTGISSDASDTLLSQWLTEIDGIRDQNGILVVMATNRMEIMDPALLRAQRTDRIIAVNRPDAQGANDLFKLYLQNNPLQEGTPESNAADLAHFMYCSSLPVATLSYNDGSKGSIAFKDLFSGAAAYNIVQRSIDLALEGDRCVISPKDLMGALDAEYRELDPAKIHYSDLERIARGKVSEIKGIKRENTLRLEDTYEIGPPGSWS